MTHEGAEAVIQSSLIQAGFGIMFVLLAEQMTALGQHRQITNEEAQKKFEQITHADPV